MTVTPQDKATALVAGQNVAPDNGIVGGLFECISHGGALGVQELNSASR